MAGDNKLPTVPVELDYYDLMILSQVISFTQEEAPGYWSSDETSDMAIAHAKLYRAEQDLAEKHPPLPPRAVPVGESPNAATRVPFDDE